jgi:hypothetical protein
MQSRHLLDQFPTQARWLHGSLEYGADGALQPLVGDADVIPVLAADPSDKEGVGFLALGIGRVAASRVEPVPSSVGFGRLLLEEFVDGFHLGGVSGERLGRGQAYLFLLVALLAQVLPAAGHLGTSHGVLLGRQMLLDLNLCMGSARFGSGGMCG